MRILIVRLSHLGDVVCSVGMLHALHDAYPSAEIAWVVQADYAGALEGLNGLSRIIRFDRNGGIRALVRLYRELRAFSPDLSVDPQGNLKSALVGLLARAPRRIGFARDHWQEPIGAIAVHERAPASAEPHLVGRVRELARHVAPTGRFRTGLDLAEGELDGGRARLAEFLPLENLAPVLLHVSTPEDNRSWPLDHWEELARRLLAAGRGVLCLSGPSEEATGRELRARLGSEPPRLAHWIGQKGLRELAALFAAASERGGVLVACDSGPMHLGWASGLRTFVLEGPQSARRTGPWPSVGDDHRELRADPSPPCAPCIARRCDHPEGPVCMEGLTPELVAAAIRSVP